eukprot:CAMPEP_0113969026 /NCGR_PEP_ID=MMETSP0011_2-20120614/9960_1 /TAXON_ID=101924 /ORGANISM="Rhodosorus marinus" /LENGTH=683 /DNA_ID=CAMNT_0000982381 /DNA_START=267 /DNA_END=2318 /DNA_ORIENTATION=+ /assembly_acc=CAM_ASM_000156
MDYGGLCGFSVAVADELGPDAVLARVDLNPVSCPGDRDLGDAGRPLGSLRRRQDGQNLDGVVNAVVGGLKETLELLIASAVVVPLFKRFNLSPVLGFLAAGVALGPHGLRLVTELDDIAQIADIGVLFLLFEMGLELSIDRLKKLRVYAFGLGTLQMALTSTALAAGALMMGAGISESLVIGTSLSLSSSAFVLQLLAERKEQSSRYATAAFGVLLLQDIAVVPLLVLVPLLSTTEWTGFQQIEGLITAILATAAKAVAGVFAVVVGGGFVLRPVFRFVSESRSAEAFTSVVLATVLGAGFITNELGLSMTLGAFIAGVLLSESSYRSRIQVDIEPFRGLLLGLFFITTGMSMDISVFLEQPLETAALIASLIAVKSTILGLLARPFNLSAPESAKLGLILGQGGEFGFVLFALANKLGFLPDDVNKILVVVIVSSMALTPLMAEIGAKLAPIIQGPQYSEVEEEERERELVKSQTRVSKNVVIIIGYGEVGHLVVDMLSRKFIPFIVIDKNESLVRDATLQGVPCVCADAEQHGFLNDHGITSPTAVVLTMNSSRIATGVVNNMQVENPEVPIYVRARDMRKMNRLKNLGVVATYPETLESSLALAEEVMRGYGIPDQDVRSIAKSLRNERGFDELKRIKKRIRADALGDFDPEVKREVTELVIVDREKMKELNDQKLRKEK